MNLLKRSRPFRLAQRPIRLHDPYDLEARRPSHIVTSVCVEFRDSGWTTSRGAYDGSDCLLAQG
jgi:hypothetical protein